MKQLVSEAIETSFDLPEASEGWQITLMKEISEIVGGGTPKTSDISNFSGNGYPWITPADLSGFNEMYISRGRRCLTEQGLKTSSAVLMPKGTVLMSSRAPIGYLAIAANELCTNQGFKSFICHPGIVPEYVFIWLKFVTPFLENMGSGSTFLEISGSRACKIPILLAPTSEQNRIVAKVEELLTRVNATKERLNKVSIILNRFRQAVLAAACSGRLTADWRFTSKELESASQLVERTRKTYREQYEGECAKAKKEGKRLPKKSEILELGKVETPDLPEIPDDWTWVYLPALGYMSRGKSKHRPRNAPHLYGGPYPFIQTGDIAQSQGLITSHRQTYSEAGLVQSHLWPTGTICITIAANIANSAILTYPACFPDSVVGLIPDEILCLKEYAEFFIRTARANLDQFAPATAQKNINIEILRDIAVPLPPLAEQNEIIRRLGSMFKLADAVEKRVAAATARAEKLSQAILAKTFRAELVPTEAELARREGRSYESASELLSRIKSERDSKRMEKRFHRNKLR